MASTLLNESGKWHPDAIERALAHGDTDKVRAAYHRGAHGDERVAMAQWWSDHLDQLRKGGDVVRLSHRTSRWIMTNPRELMVMGDLLEQGDQVRSALASCRSQQQRQPKNDGFSSVNEWVGF